MLHGNSTTGPAIIVTTQPFYFVRFQFNYTQLYPIRDQDQSFVYIHLVTLLHRVIKALIGLLFSESDPVNALTRSLLPRMH